MGKYGIGARVRDADGDEGVIVGKRKGERRVQYGEDLLGIDMWVAKSKLTPIADNDDAPSAQERAEGATKFKVGDRVKVTSTEDGQANFVGCVGKIKSMPNYKDYLVTLDGKGELFFAPSELTLLPTTPEWQPKEGDRVTGSEGNNTWTKYTVKTVNSDGTIDVVAKGLFGNDYTYHNKSLDLFQPLPIAAEAQEADAENADEPTYKVGDRVLAKGRGWEDSKDIGIVKTVLDFGAHVEFHDGWAAGHAGRETDGATNRWYFDFDQLEPAPLTIEAGKFYRTRDGHKVGPISRGPSDEFFWESNDCFYGEDGHAPHLERSHDLVAEWPADKPTLTPAFTPGQTVRALVDTDPSAAQPLRKGVAYQVVSCDGDRVTVDGSSTTYNADMFEATNGKFKAGDWVVSDVETALLNKGKTYRVVDAGREWVEVEAGGVRSYPNYYFRPAWSSDFVPEVKFRVGDRVRVKGGTLTGVVHARSSRGAMSFVMDGDTIPGPQFWHDDELVLLSRPSFIVCKLSAAGKPLPATHPRVHASRTAATQEAARLTRIHGGTFATYERVA